LTVPLNSLENSRKLCHEASDRLIDIIWVNWRCSCGCISRPTFKLSASLLDIMGKSKEISQDLRIKVDLQKSGSSLEAISKCLKVPRSSVHTILHNYKHHRTTQPSYHSGRRHVLSPKRLTYFCVKCANQSQNNSKWPCEDAGGNRCTVKRVQYRT
jgi:transposase